MRKTTAVAVLTMVLLMAGGRGAAWAADAMPEDKGKADKGADAAKTPEPKKFASEHRLKVSGGGELVYTATAEDIYLQDRDGKPTARFFTISYIEKGVKRQEDRPMTFFFNGGPGSSSVWLHLGFVGPKRIDIPSDAQDPGAPPYRLKDNPWSLLRVTDLVVGRPGRHRLQPRARREEGRGLLGLRRGRRLRRRLHPRLPHHAQPLELAQVHPRRELRRHPRLDARTAAPGADRHRPQRRDPRLAGDQHGRPALLHRRQRSHLRHAPADARRDGVVPQEAPGFLAEPAGAAHRGRAVRLRRVPAGPLPRRLCSRRRRRGRSPTSCTATRACPRQYILNSDLRLYAPRFAKELLRGEGDGRGLPRQPLRAEGARQRIGVPQQRPVQRQDGADLRLALPSVPAQ